MTLGYELWRWQVDRTGSGSYAVAGYDISGVETSGSVIEMKTFKTGLKWGGGGGAETMGLEIVLKFWYTNKLKKKNQTSIP
jgi:hypothetical protein